MSPFGGWWRQSPSQATLPQAPGHSFYYKSPNLAHELRSQAGFQENTFQDELKVHLSSARGTHPPKFLPM